MPHVAAGLSTREVQRLRMLATVAFHGPWLLELTDTDCQFRYYHQCGREPRAGRYRIAISSSPSSLLFEGAVLIDREQVSVSPGLFATAVGLFAQCKPDDDIELYGCALGGSSLPRRMLHELRSRGFRGRLFHPTTRSVEPCDEDLEIIKVDEMLLPEFARTFPVDLWSRAPNRSPVLM